MTTGEFHSFPVSSIWIDRDKRQRRELKNIPELAASIARSGLINPIVIKRDGELVAGERRYSAVTSLGWDHISIQFTDELDPAKLQLIELEENIRRENIEWAEECRAVLAIHEIHVTLDPAWTATQTADDIGMSKQAVADKLSVALELKKGNAKLVSAERYSIARNIVARIKSREKDSADQRIAVVTKAPARSVPLLNEDFHEWSAAYTGPRFNFIHCDFPYGINAQNIQQGSEVIEKGSYDDSPNIYRQLLKTLANSMSNVVADSAHLIFWFSMDYYTETKTALENMGWKVNPFPLIWYKSDNTGIVPDAQRGPRRVYETAFFASRGDRKLTANGTVANAVAHSGADKEIHMSEKPQTMLRHFFRMVVDDNSRVLDPTAGSANALKVATALGAASILGLERDPEFYQRAVDAYYLTGEE